MIINQIKKIDNIWMVLAIILALSANYLLVLYPQMNRWGLSETQAAMPLPGDGLEPGKIISSTRGMLIHAPAPEVWKWVVQLGQERAGFYSNDWLENLVLSDIHNADQIRPEWQARKLGDTVYGAGGIYKDSSTWTIRAYKEGELTYLWGNIVVLPVDSKDTLLITRSVSPPSSLIMQFTYDWIHFVMERGMLLGIKARAEGTLNNDIALLWIARLGWIAAALGMAAVLFIRRRGWAWGLIALGYAVSIIIFTGDVWSALAGFLWWGVITAGFVLWSHRWWKGLALATAFVVLVFVIFPVPFLSFGILFWLIGLGYGIFWLRRQPRANA